MYRELCACASTVFRSLRETYPLRSKKTKAVVTSSTHMENRFQYRLFHSLLSDLKPRIPKSQKSRNPHFILFISSLPSSSNAASIRCGNTIIISHSKSAQQLWWYLTTLVVRWFISLHQQSSHNSMWQIGLSFLPYIDSQ